LHQFSATAQVRKLNYICVPTLDGYAPGDEDFGKLISKLSASSEEVYIHCAAGHGRSAAIAVALLVGRGLASDLTEAETTVKAKRPLISIKMALLHKLTS
jgi:protein-tyrosine phosphatase